MSKKRQYPAPPSRDMEPFDRITQVFTYFRDAAADRGSFESHMLSAVSLVSCSTTDQTSEWSLTVSPQITNSIDILHGGASSSILDMLTSMTLMTVPGASFTHNPHVSRTLSLSFLRPIPVGTTVKVRCKVLSIGKKTANIRGEIVTEDGKVCVSCVHDKASLGEPKL